MVLFNFCVHHEAIFGNIANDFKTTHREKKQRHEFKAGFKKPLLVGWDWAKSLNKTLIKSACAKRLFALDVFQNIQHTPRVRRNEIDMNQQQEKSFSQSWKSSTRKISPVFVDRFGIKMWEKNLFVYFVFPVEEHVVLRKDVCLFVCICRKIWSEAYASLENVQCLATMTVGSDEERPRKNDGEWIVERDEKKP